MATKKTRKKSRVKLASVSQKKGRSIVVVKKRKIGARVRKASKNTAKKRAEKKFGKNSAGKKGYWIIRRKTLGYSGLPEESVFPFAFTTKSSAQSMMKELGECACESAMAFTQDDYKLRKRGASALEVYSPDAEKDWYSQSFSVEEGDIGCSQVVKAVDSVPYDKVYSWASPKLEDAPKGRRASGNWAFFGLEEWAVILAKRPELQDRIDFKCCGVAESWCDSRGLVKLLKACPALIERVIAEAKPALDLINEWDEILSVHPQLFRYCKKLGYCDTWSKKSGDWWCTLLSDQPQFAELCEWRKFDKSDWFYLLEKQPQFLGKCRETGLLDEIINGASDERSFWASVLSEDPMLIDRCPPEMLDNELFEEIVERNVQAAHQLIGRFDTSEFDWSNWTSILSADPTFASECNWKEEVNWGELLSKQPGFFDNCRCRDKFGIDNWVGILCERPDLEKRFKDWKSLSTENWVNLLRAQPQFADRCDHWSEFSVEDWFVLLCGQAKFAAKCKCWDEFSEGQWSEILSNAPSLSNKCNLWSAFSTKSWVELLTKQPQFAAKCAFDFKPYTSWLKEVNPWAKLLEKRPEFADKCDWSKFGGSGLDRLTKKYQGEIGLDCPLLSLVTDQPSLADKCDWSKLQIDKHIWKRILGRPAMAVIVAKHFDKRMLAKMITAEEWAVLLAEDPSMDELFLSVKLVR